LRINEENSMESMSVRAASPASAISGSIVVCVDNANRLPENEMNAHMEGQNVLLSVHTQSVVSYAMHILALYVGYGEEGERR